MEETTKTTNTVTKLARFVINGELDGFPFEVSFRGKAEVLSATVAKLKAAGATSPKASTPTVTNASAAPDAPTHCPIHNAKLKPSRKPGTFYCPKKDGDDYCDFKHTI
ncbi:MAG: hypothetical protein HOP19_18485 [Acidobacteria bacterium]|nr:hypothetical protein [Acidobacteriota bacterium]